MKSECGRSRVILVLICVVLMLLLGPTVYVIFQENGIYDREIQPVIENYINQTNIIDENTIAENTVVQE